MIDEKNKHFMELALQMGYLAGLEGEVPIGAVVVKDDKVIGYGRNRRENKKNALYHAELEAISMACNTLKGWRLFGCDLYVTLEPCPMCSGAIINARLSHVYYGATDHRFGAVGSVTNLLEMPFNHLVTAEKGVMERPCKELLTGFFKRLRYRKENHIRIRRFARQNTASAYGLYKENELYLTNPLSPSQFHQKLSGGYAIVALTDENEVVGIISAMQGGEITILFCKASHCHHGIGTELLHAMELKAIVTKTDCLSIVSPANHTFFTNYGFVQKSEADIYEKKVQSDYVT